MTLVLIFCVASVAVLLIVTAKLTRFIAYLQGELHAPIEVFLEDPSAVDPVPTPSIFQPPSKSLSVIVPAYNEEDRLGPTLEEVITYLQSRRNKQGPHFTFEVIIVDDGSKDKTLRVAFDYVKRHGFDTVRVLRVPHNRGKGHAVRRGMMVARGEYCLFMDADGATRFADLELLEAALSRCMVPAAKGTMTVAGSEKALEGQLGAALGSRAHLEKAAMAKRSPIRNFLTQGFHFLVTFVAGGRVRDTQCGFKLFTRRAAALLYANQRLQRWCFDVELIYLADCLGIPLTEVSVQWTEMPGSKIRATSIISMAFELLTLKVAYQIFGAWSVHTEAELVHRAS